MIEDIQYAIFAAAYKAWETDTIQCVDGYGEVWVIPESVRTLTRGAAEENGWKIEESSVNLPKIWIEHEGNRAEVVWTYRVQSIINRVIPPKED